MEILPENDFQIRRLSTKFYSAYDGKNYPEILAKNNRSYNCLLFETHYDYFICVPFRSEIKHPYSFRFKKSKRSQSHKSGLDYQKIVIIENLDYLDDGVAIVDKDEYREAISNIEKIKRDALHFVEDYVKYWKNDKKSLSNEEFNRRYKWSSLQYFHLERGIK